MKQHNYSFNFVHSYLKYLQKDLVLKDDFEKLQQEPEF